MGRFYTTDKPKFVDDFIYQPPYSAIDRALQVNQTGLEDAAGQVKLLDTIDNKFIDDPVEREKLAKWQNDLKQQTDDLVSQMQEDPTNWRQATTKINDIKNDLQQRYTTGDLYTQRQSKEDYDKMLEYTKNLDPSTKTAVENYWLDKWRQDPNRNTAFTWEAAQNQRDLAAELDAAVLKNKPDLIQSEKDIKERDGRWHRIGNSNNFVSVNALKKYAAEFFNSPMYKSYFTDREKYGLDGKYLDENGELLNPLSKESALNPIVENSKYRFSNVKKDIISPYQENEEELALRREQFNFQKKQYEDANSVPQNEVVPDLGNALNMKDAMNKGELAVKDFVNNFNLGKNGYTPNLEKVIKAIGKAPNTEAKLNLINDYYVSQASTRVNLLKSRGMSEKEIKNDRTLKMFSGGMDKFDSYLKKIANASRYSERHFPGTTDQYRQMKNATEDLFMHKNSSLVVNISSSVSGVSQRGIKFSDISSPNIPHGQKRNNGTYTPALGYPGVNQEGQIEYANKDNVNRLTAVWVQPMPNSTINSEKIHKDKDGRYVPERVLASANVITLGSDPQTGRPVTVTFGTTNDSNFNTGNGGSMTSYTTHRGSSKYSLTKKQKNK